ncbi:aquaporin-like protein [Macrolepiota fuliginosa MF-IS2]|uniref:Aquaporin-like protein n=1 Tax=Macrolepiota fuliginosa MF-IS2 TaxID=1400762 RepID=A0A9P5X675_9AGAR|nr:aquaporin-like protein [Macrolepiota fuliginosa MF-IS2]
MELWAEFVGCFIYSWLGIGSAVNQINAIVNNQPTFASGPIQVGFAVSFGIIIAVSVCGTTSAGHYNPGITLAQATYRSFPKWKVPFYWLVQIVGGYCASMAVYYSNRYIFIQVEEVMREQGVLNELMYTTAGPSGIFAFYLPPGQTYWGAWLNEFVASLVACTAYWAAMDPANALVTPRMSVWIIAFAYGVTIWGFGGILNTSRDLGGRLWAITVWGTRANGGRFGAISALTNFAAMLTAVFLYEVFITDSRRVVNVESMEHIRLMTNQLKSSETQREASVEMGTNSSGSSATQRISDVPSLAPGKRRSGGVEAS